MLNHLVQYLGQRFIARKMKSNALPRSCVLTQAQRALIVDLNDAALSAAQRRVLRYRKLCIWSL
jgi:hypothetical protein